MFSNKKEKLRFILSCILSVVFIWGSVFTVSLAFESIFLENLVQTVLYHIVAVAFGALMKIAVLIFGLGVCSAGALASLLAHSLKSHENPKVGKTMKFIYIFDLSILAIDVLSIAIILL